MCCIQHPTLFCCMFNLHTGSSTVFNNYITACLSQASQYLNSLPSFIARLGTKLVIINIFLKQIDVYIKFRTVIIIVVSWPAARLQAVSSPCHSAWLYEHYIYIAQQLVHFYRMAGDNDTELWHHWQRVYWIHRNAHTSVYNYDTREAK